MTHTPLMSDWAYGVASCFSLISWRVSSSLISLSTSSEVSISSAREYTVLTLLFIFMNLSDRILPVWIEYCIFHFGLFIVPYSMFWHTVNLRISQVLLGHGYIILFCLNVKKKEKKILSSQKIIKRFAHKRFLYKLSTTRTTVSGDTYVRIQHRRKILGKTSLKNPREPLPDPDELRG